MWDKIIVFDLDDTLLSEIDFLHSAYREITALIQPNSSDKLFNELVELYHEGANVFEVLEALYPQFSKQYLLQCYRNHNPSLSLNTGALELLNFCKNQRYFLGLITDGRAKTQRNKLKATNIESYFDLIIISEEFGSEKPNRSNYDIFHQFSSGEFYYIGDNPKKDFITPNYLGWKTICLLDSGKNIHPQNFEVSPEYLPSIFIKNLIEVFSVIE
jgi:putative hydrolase of the HAD superfamily